MTVSWSEHTKMGHTDNNVPLSALSYHQIDPWFGSMQYAGRKRNLRPENEYYYSID